MDKTFKEVRQLAHYRLCQLLLNRVPEMSTGDFATRILGTLEEEFGYRISMPALEDSLPKINKADLEIKRDGFFDN